VRVLLSFVPSKRVSEETHFGQTKRSYDIKSAESNRQIERSIDGDLLKEALCRHKIDLTSTYPT
jgi:hypothetical protein